MYSIRVKSRAHMRAAPGRSLEASLTPSPSPPLSLSLSLSLSRVLLDTLLDLLHSGGEVWQRFAPFSFFHNFGTRYLWGMPLRAGDMAMSGETFGGHIGLFRTGCYHGTFFHSSKTGCSFRWNPSESSGRLGRP